MGGGFKLGRVSNCTPRLFSQQGIIADLKIPPIQTPSSNLARPSFLLPPGWVKYKNELLLIMSDLCKCTFFWGGGRDSQNSDSDGPKTGRKRSDFAVWVCFKHTGQNVVKPFVSAGFSGGCAKWLWFKESGEGKKNGGESGIRTRGRVWPLRRFSKPFLSATQASLRV